MFREIYYVIILGISNDLWPFLLYLITKIVHRKRERKKKYTHTNIYCTPSLALFLVGGSGDMAESAAKANVRIWRCRR
jgi:hypothetical protein